MSTGSRRTGVTLREVRPTDLDTFFAHQQDETARAMAAFVTPHPQDRAAFDRHWARILADGTIVPRTVVAEREVVGHIVRFARDGTPEVTYWIGRDAWGRGIASAALAAFLEVVTERPLYARAAKDNVASVRVLEKCGFRVSGADRGFAEARGETIDEVVLVLQPAVGTT